MEKNQIKKKVDELIVKQINYVNTLKDGSEEKAKANDELAKLYALRDSESCSFKDKVKLTLDGLGVVISATALGVTVWATKKGFKFEETGTFVSKTFGQWFNGVFKRIK